MSSNTADEVLLLGGTGKVSSRIAPILSREGYQTLIASRSAPATSLPGCQAVKFDWLDGPSHAALFDEHPSISSVFLVPPPIFDPFTIVKSFVDLALSHGVKRFVILSASALDVGDGPLMTKISEYVISLKVEYAILQPTWFMENFTEMSHMVTIRDEDKIVTAAGNGKVPFVSVEDIAAVAVRALVDEKSHDTAHLILGPELLSYDDVAALLTRALGRHITHVHISEDEAANAMVGFGLDARYARLLAQLDTHIKEGKEERLNDVVVRGTGREPRRVGELVEEGVRKGVWVKK